MPKPTLLYVSPWAPTFANVGSSMRAAIQIAVLCEWFDVTLAIVGNQETLNRVETLVGSDLTKFCSKVVVIRTNSFICQPWSRIRNVRVRTIIEAIWPIPSGVGACAPAIAELGTQLAGKHFDVVHCFRLHTGFLRSLKGRDVSFGRSVLDLDDHESRAKFRLARYLPALFG